MKKLAWTALMASIALLPLTAAAGPNTCEWFGMNTWTFASGTTPYIFACNASNNQSAAAYSYAEAKCQAAWDAFAQGYSDTGYFDVHLSLATVTWDPTLRRWNYSCRTCIDGLLPYFGQVELARISLAEAGDSATGLVPGEVMSLEYRRGEGGEGDHYLVEVWGAEGMTQVRVDAATGRSSLAPRGEAGAVCSAR